LIKIGIVGPEAGKWKPEQISKARIIIRNILVAKDPYISFKQEGFYSIKDTVLVSGHCPKGGVDIWAEEIADELGIKKEIYPAEADKEGKYHWDDKREFDPKTYDEHIMGGAFYFYAKLRKLKGYRSRNIQVAEACDVLYCIVPRAKRLIDTTEYMFCKHCCEFGHPTNGGCWTLKYLRQHFPDKEVHLVVVQ